MLSIDVTGIEQVVQRLRTLEAQISPAVARALDEEAQRIMGISVGLVPIDTGLLRSTAHVERPVMSGPETVVTLSYGSNGTAPYAAIVHENTAMNHPNGGQHHYLSQPFFEATGTMTARLAASLRAQLGG